MGGQVGPPWDGRGGRFRALGLTFASLVLSVEVLVLAGCVERFARHPAPVQSNEVPVTSC